MSWGARLVLFVSVQHASQLLSIKGTLLLLLFNTTREHTPDPQAQGPLSLWTEGHFAGARAWAVGLGGWGSTFPPLAVSNGENPPASSVPRWVVVGFPRLKTQD